MTLVAILLFAGGTYALRLAGPVLYNRIDVSDRTRRWLTLPTVALLAALAATATLLSGGEFDSVARVVEWRSGSSPPSEGCRSSWSCS